MKTENMKTMYEIKVNKYLAEVFKSIVDFKLPTDRHHIVEALYNYVYLTCDDGIYPTKTVFFESYENNDKYYAYVLRAFCTFFMQSEIPASLSILYEKDIKEIRKSLDTKNDVVAQAVKQFDLPKLEGYAYYALTKATEDILVA